MGKKIFTLTVDGEEFMTKGVGENMEIGISGIGIEELNEEENAKLDDYIRDIMDLLRTGAIRAFKKGQES